MAHGRPEELAKSRENARLKKLGEREMRKPPAQWWADGWNSRPFRPVGEAAEFFGVDKSTVTRWQAWTVHQEALVKAVHESPRPVGLPANHFEWTADHIPLLIDAFLVFRGKYFRTPQREAYETPEFQVKWASKILGALVTGGQEMILAPVRHGKTMLLVHLCIFLFCLDPNIRVLWVSVAQRIAEKPVNLARAILSSNPQLIEDYAGPGRTFEPPARGHSKWTGQEFTVATRSDYDINGPNMMALGQGGTILSLNADIIIVDDIEDLGSVAQAGTRDKTKEWWVTQLSSRKEEHTGMFVIGSRQHPDDLYNHILGDPDWHVIVERAHDPACPVEGPDGHWDCLLFPEVRTYKWLMSQKRAADRKHPALFEMVYQNVSRVDGLVVFPEDDVKGCRDGGVEAGLVPAGKPGEGGIRLVGGLDPAISGFQAAVLLAYQTVPELKIWLVDLDNKEGGGITAAEALIRRWYEKYGLSHWVAEVNLLGRISKYKEVQDYTSAHGIHVEDWRTHNNKTDQFYGVTSLAPLFRNKNIVLPYKGLASQQVSDTLTSQLVVWDEGNSRNKNRTGFKDDLVMAFWFAWDPIRRARQEFNAEMGVDTGSYSAFGFDDVPWDTMLETV